MGIIEPEYYVVNVAGEGECCRRGREKVDVRRLRKAARLGKGVGRLGWRGVGGSARPQVEPGLVEYYLFIF